MSIEFLGHGGNVVAAASGVPISFRDFGAISFLCYEDDGSTILTLTESTSAAAAGEQNLAVIDRISKGPGVGGTWTEVTQTAAATYDNADDTTNDAFIITVHADELSDGYTHVEATVDGGTCTAILHAPRLRRRPNNLRSTIA